MEQQLELISLIPSGCKADLTTSLGDVLQLIFDYNSPGVRVFDLEKEVGLVLLEHLQQKMATNKALAWGLSLKEAFEADPSLIQRQELKNTDKRNYKVLIVDDEIDLLENMSEFLEMEGFVPIRALNGKEGLETFRNNPDISAVLSDLRMPVMDGLTMVTEIRKINSKVPIMVLSGHGEKEEAVECIKQGVNDFIDKPFDIDHVMNRLGHLCQAYYEETQQASQPLVHSLQNKISNLFSDNGKDLKQKLDRLTSDMNRLFSAGQTHFLINTSAEDYIVCSTTNQALKGLCLTIDGITHNPEQLLINSDQLKVLTYDQPIVLHEDLKSLPSEYNAIIIPLIKGRELVGILAMSKYDAHRHMSMATLESLRQVAPIITDHLYFSNQLGSYKEMSSTLKQQAEVLVHKLDTLEKEKNVYEKLALVGEMSGSITHEIKNPLAIALGHLDIIAKTPKENHERINRSLERIRESLLRINTITSTITRMSHMGKDDSEENLTSPTFPLNHAISQALSFSHEKLRRAGIELQVELSKDYLLQGQQIQLEQVISNLLNNSIDALSDQKEKRIKISAMKASRGVVELRVEDNGPGIPEYIQTDLFTKFVTTKEVGKGTGLGLKICKGIIEKFGGDIIYERSANKTIFRITLPTLSNA